MTISNAQARRIRTFDSAHSQDLDQELLYMVMNGLAVVRVRSQSWTQSPVLSAYLTTEGDKAWTEWNENRIAEEEAQEERAANGQFGVGA